MNLCIIYDLRFEDDDENDVNTWSVLKKCLTDTDNNVKKIIKSRNEFILNCEV